MTAETREPSGGYPAPSPVIGFHRNDIPAKELNTVKMSIPNEEYPLTATKTSTGGSEPSVVIRYEAGPSLHEPKPVIQGQSDEASGPTRHSVSSTPRSAPPRYPFAFFFGIILPILTTLVEWTTRMSASLFLDPLPNVWHTLLVLSVPAINVWSWRTLRQGRSRGIEALGFASAFSLGILAYYSLLYAVLTPFAFMGILVYGLGLLPLTPLLGLVAALRLRHLLKERLEAVGIPIRGGGWGFMAAMAALTLVALPIYLTRQWSQSYVSGTTEQKADALRWLRLIGSEQTLLRDCYSTSGRDSGIFNIYPQGKPVTTEQARDLYYRVTGERFNSKAPPQLGLASSRWNFMDELSWDPDAGGTRVGGRLKGLSLAQSHLNGIVNSDAAWSYQEWTLEFENSALVDREARAQIQLPHGGVVSRLTLWVNGEEREAAFASCEQVRAAYQKVVTVQRRDPVLVTHSGPDRVLMQCFPVPSRGGKIKVRLGITAPLSIVSPETASMAWPHFIERNFGIGTSLTHQLTLEGNAAIQNSTSRYTTAASQAGTHTVHAQWTDKELASPENRVLLARSTAAQKAWSADRKGMPGFFVQQEFSKVGGTLPRRAVIVVDGSKSMKPFRNDIVESLRQLPEGLETSVWIADDIPTELIPFRKKDQSLAELAEHRLRQVSWAGGQDNLPTLIKAWNSSRGLQDSVLVWIHSPQPEELTRAQPQPQPLPWSNYSSGPTVHELQVIPGSDAVMNRLYASARLESVERQGTVLSDLTALFKGWSPETLHWVARRERMPDTSTSADQRGLESSDHLCRLWAYEEILRLIESNRSPEAVRLARHYQLVTPVSGAVVLETQQQYEEAGLEPVSADSVPVVPEPGVLALVAMGFAILYLVKRGSRSARDPRAASRVAP